MNFIAESNDKPTGRSGDSRGLWMKVRRVLKTVVEVVGFIAAIKTLLS